jgi:hypothetical protein
MKDTELGGRSEGAHIHIVHLSDAKTSLELMKVEWHHMKIMKFAVPLIHDLFEPMVSTPRNKIHINEWIEYVQLLLWTRSYICQFISSYVFLSIKGVFGRFY